LKKAIVLLFATIALAGCNSAGTFLMSKKKAIDAAEAFGLRDVQIESGWRFASGCSNNDETSRSFTATSARGQLRVEGVVCGGLFFKAPTVRIIRVIHSK
jgi:hypothetical protein